MSLLSPFVCPSFYNKWSLNLISKDGKAITTCVSIYLQSRIKRSFRPFALGSNLGGDQIKFYLYLPKVKIPYRDSSINSMLADAPLLGSWQREKKCFISLQTKYLVYFNTTLKRPRCCCLLVSPSTEGHQ